MKIQISCIVLENIYYNIIIYSNPDNKDGLEYEFDLYRRLNETVDFAARATGKVDTSIDNNTGKPVINIGAGFNLKNGNRLQGFINSETEYGFLLKSSLTPKSVLTFGVSAYKDDNGDINPRLGYKLEI